MPRLATREDDERLLTWLWLRDSFQSHQQIAETFCVSRHVASSALYRVDTEFRKSEEEPW